MDAKDLRQFNVFGILTVNRDRITGACSSEKPDGHSVECALSDAIDPIETIGDKPLIIMFGAYVGDGAPHVGLKSLDGVSVAGNVQIKQFLAKFLKKFKESL